MKTTGLGVVNSDIEGNRTRGRPRTKLLLAVEEELLLNGLKKRINKVCTAVEQLPSAGKIAFRAELF